MYALKKGRVSSALRHPPVKERQASLLQLPLPEMDLVVETGDYIGLKVKFFAIDFETG